MDFRESKVTILPVKNNSYVSYPLFAKIPSSIFEIMGHMSLKTSKILSKIDYKTFFIGGFQSKLI